VHIYEEFKQSVEERMREHVDISLEQIESFEDENDPTDELMTAGVGFYFFESPKDIG